MSWGGKVKKKKKTMSILSGQSGLFSQGHRL